MSATSHCRNCGTFLGEPAGNFCSNCGQDTLNHPPSFWEFIHEFVTHYVALEGKLWKTLLLLFFKPAQLTREYREGRKQRYISPLRLYITASFLFFLMFKLLDFNNVDLKIADAKDTNTISKVVSASEAVATANNAKAPGYVINFSYEKPAADAPNDKGLETAIDAWKKGESFDLACEKWDTPTSCAWLEKRLKTKYQGKTDAQMWATIKLGLAANVPYAIFLALPFFALFTKLLYIRRGYFFGEHFVYALHIHAFTFFAMLLMMLIPSAAIVGTVAVLATLYYFVGLHRFFGGRWWMNVLRYGVLAFVYQTFLAILATILLLFVFIS